MRNTVAAMLVAWAAVPAATVLTRPPAAAVQRAAEERAADTGACRRVTTEGSASRPDASAETSPSSAEPRSAQCGER